MKRSLEKYAQAARLMESINITNAEAMAFMECGDKKGAYKSLVESSKKLKAIASMISKKPKDRKPAESQPLCKTIQKRNSAA